MSHQNTNPSGAQALLSADPAVRFVDVRTVEEFEQGHVPGAYNIPLAFRTPQGMQPNPDFAAVMARHFPKDTPLVLGCKAGGRSQRACELLSRQGFSRLWNMQGGMLGATDETGRLLEPGWIACGLPTAKASAPERTWRELARAAMGPSR
jgi:rhodanese-related sulfurtransferase